MLIELSRESIQSDITEYTERLVSAETKLSELSSGFLPLADHKKRAAVRRELELEVLHVKQLITYAEAALTEQGGV